LDGVIWYVMYEAGCFFSAASLARMFRECGFQVLDILPALQGAHFEIESRPAMSPVPTAFESTEQIAPLQSRINDFAQLYAAKCREWDERFAGFRRRGMRVVLWAAGMRAISLLVNCPNAAAHVEVVVDANVKRQGRYLPKTAQRVIDARELISYRPDLVLCTNPTYADEIRAQLVGLNLRCDYEVLT
jgi:hypothetical protein